MKAVTTQDRAEMLGCVILFTESSVFASVLAVIRRHVCDSMLGKPQILIRNEMPATCKTPFPVIMASLLSQLVRFGLQDVQTDVFPDP